MNILSGQFPFNIDFNCANCAGYIYPGGFAPGGAGAAPVGGYTDLVVNASNNKIVHSVTRPFITADAGDLTDETNCTAKVLFITSGTGWTPGQYTVKSVDGSGNATLSASPAAVNVTGGHGTLGYLTELAEVQGDASSLSQHSTTPPTIDGLNYGYTCPACGYTVQNMVPVSVMETLCAGENPMGLITIVKATLTNTPYTQAPPP